MSVPAETLTPPPVAPRQRLISLRGILPFLKPHRRMLVLWLAALAVSSSATLYFPVAIKQLIDKGFTQGGDVDSRFLLLFGVSVVMALATAARFYFVSLLGERVSADLRTKL